MTASLKLYAVSITARVAPEAARPGLEAGNFYRADALLPGVG